MFSKIQGSRTANSRNICSLIPEVEPQIVGIFAEEYKETGPHIVGIFVVKFQKVGLENSRMFAVNIRKEVPQRLL